VVYDKSIRLTAAHRSSIGVGPIVSYMQIDAAKASTRARTQCWDLHSLLSAHT
jgi:hypothetical protein